ncbi:MAG: hypothetical protein JSS21_06635 [Proteobacteria bacterium]|nr:hypothetical protein [Pseudomonadota bacterium]
MELTTLRCAGTRGAGAGAGFAAGEGLADFAGARGVAFGLACVFPDAVFPAFPLRVEDRAAPALRDAGLRDAAFPAPRLAAGGRALAFFTERFAVLRALPATRFAATVLVLRAAVFLPFAAFFATFFVDLRARLVAMSDLLFPLGLHAE